MLIERRSNQGINVLKAVCCIAVTLMHCRFPGKFGAMISYVVRFPVSVFFMISGYYSVNKDTDWMKKKALYTLKLIVFTELSYCLLHILTYLHKGERPIEYLIEKLGKMTWYEIILSGGVFCGPAWYLYALLGTWILLIVLRKLFPGKNGFCLIPVLLIVALIGRNLDLGDPEETIWMFRNALLYGLPFALLGAWIKQYEKIFSNKAIIVIFAVGMVLIVIEYCINPVIHDFQLSTVFTATGCFLLASRHSSVPSKLHVLNYLGAKMSLWVYLLHAAIRDVVDYIGVCFGIRYISFFEWTRPIIIISCTLAISYGISCISTLTKNTRRVV